MKMTDRRETVRFDSVRPAKVECSQTGRYLAGRTRNLSASGALLEVEHRMNLRPGQRVRVGIARSQHQAVLGSNDMVEAVVVRSMGMSDRQWLAIRFAAQARLAQSA